MTIRIGIIGDLHAHWDDIDVALLSDTDYDLLFFVGDLGGGTRESTLRIARTLSKLAKPTLVLPGNNDTWDLAELAAELSHREGMRRLIRIRQGDTDPTSGALIRLCGFSSHRLTTDEVDVTLLTGRPHSMGGEDLSFPEHMQAYYGIDSMASSTERLCALVDAAETRDLLFFAHNGPLGLGGDPADMWGCDFRPGGGDWGDPDLADAIAYARDQGRRVLAVVGGHMHLRTKAGAERPWHRAVDDVVYVNSARVPRIFSHESEVRRHHVSLTIGPAGVRFEERYLG